MRRFLLAMLLVLAACSEPSSRDTLDSMPVQATVVNNTAAVLNAGDIDDNSQWGHYGEYRADFLRWGSQIVRNVDVSERHLIRVADAQGFPVPGARVIVYGAQDLLIESQTYADGRTLFFPSAWVDAQNEQAFRVVVGKEDQAVEFTLDRQLSSDWQITLDALQSAQTAQLDVLFLLDSTGSMGDEIAQLQENIVSISEQINQSNVDVRYGMVTYRDRGDEYLYRIVQFVPDVETFQTYLSAVRAGGGGDIPEALNEALNTAIRGMEWRGEDTIKLVFLIADAPPHLDYADDYDYSQEMIAAAWQGIKIYPIASSGLSKNGEFIFRQMAQYTLGRFLFLTYQAGTSGTPGTQRADLEASSGGNYSVEELDELVLKLIEEELAAPDIPLQSTGFTPSLTRVSLPAANPIPATFNLIRPQSAATVPNSPATDRLFDPFGVILPTLVAILGLIAGYMLRRVEKRKRKNDEYIWESDSRP